MTEKEKFAREVAEVEQLIYDELCDEVHELGRELYHEAENIHYIIEEKCNKAYAKFHAEHPEYSYRAFCKVFYFMLEEGEELAQELEALFF